MAKKDSKQISKNEKFREEKKREKAKKQKIHLGIGVLFVLLIGAYFMTLEDSTIETKQKDLIFGDDVIVMTYFHWTRCSHCIEQNKFNKILMEKYPNLNIVEHEITESDAMNKYKEIAATIEELNAEQFPGTPLTIIDGKINIGYGTDETTGLKLIDMIEEAQKKIDMNWNSETMTRTVDLRAQTNNQE